MSSIKYILLDPIAWLHVLYLLLDFRFYMQCSEHAKENYLTLNKYRNY